MLVDVSVWIDFFNVHDSCEAQLLAASIADGIVLVEMLSGLRGDAEAALFVHL